MRPVATAQVVGRLSAQRFVAAGQQQMREAARLQQLLGRFEADALADPREPMGSAPRKER